MVKKWDGGVINWVNLIQDRNRRGTVVKKVMKFLFHKTWRISGLAEDRLVSHEGLVSYLHVLRKM
jgi:predicted rRNA methylase YqxC with S4 and FtsJ domains